MRVSRSAVVWAGVISTSAGRHEAMAAPAIAIAPVPPGTDAEKDSVIEIARAVEADRGTGVGSVVVITVRANRRRPTDVDGDLCAGLWRRRGHQGSKGEECRGAEVCFPSMRKEFDPGLAGAGWASDFHLGPPMRA